MTRRRVAAYGHRAFNAGFPAMNPIGRLSQRDPLQTFAHRESGHISFSPDNGASGAQEMGRVCPHPS